MGDDGAPPQMPAMAENVFAGGMFFGTPDPARLIQWFRDALGIPVEASDDGGMLMLPCGDSMTVLGIHKAPSDAAGLPDAPVQAEPYGRQPLMVNLRVADLAVTLALLDAADWEYAGPRDYEGVGRFAWTRTPDGHDIELWQP